MIIFPLIFKLLLLLLLFLKKPSANVKLGWPRTVTVTILSNDNAFGIISFDMVWLQLDYLVVAR